MARGTLFIISAPSGAGKTSLVNALLKDGSDPLLGVSISHTTRARRPGEVDGVNYHFVTVEDFRAMQRDDAFLESAEVFGNLYGTSRAWVQAQLEQGFDVILEIDWQGARQIQTLVPSATWIFILPPSLEALEERLKKRAQDDEATIQKRIAAAKEELSHVREANYLVINDLFEAALFELRQIISATRLRADCQLARHQDLARQLGVLSN